MPGLFLRGTDFADAPNAVQINLFSRTNVTVFLLHFFAQYTDSQAFNTGSALFTFSPPQGVGGYVAFLPGFGWRGRAPSAAWAA